MVPRGEQPADGDVWADDDFGEGPGQDELDREWRVRREEHFSSGYREGLEAGKHEAVQDGFNDGERRPWGAACSCTRRWHDSTPPPHVLSAGYRCGAAAGFECGAARGAAATLAALAPRLPVGLGGVLQQEPRTQGQPELAAMPYQQLQQEVCSSLMAAGAQPAAAAPAGAPVQLPARVDATLRSFQSSLRAAGLQPPASCKG